MKENKHESVNTCDHCHDDENQDSGIIGIFSMSGALKSLTPISGMLLAVGFIGSFSLPDGWSTLFYLLSIASHEELIFPSIIIIARELIISSFRQFLAESLGENPVKVSFIAKAKTTVQITSISLTLQNQAQADSSQVYFEIIADELEESFAISQNTVDIEDPTFINSPFLVTKSVLDSLSLNPNNSQIDFGSL